MRRAAATHRRMTPPGRNRSLPSTRFRCDRLILICIGAMLAACQPVASVTPSERVDSPSGDDSPAQTDSSRYTLRAVPGGYDASANVTFANRGTSPISFARCGFQSNTPMWSLRRTGADSTARAFIGVAWACVGGVPSGQLAPGDSIVLRVWLGSTASPNANPPIQPAERVGRFRVELMMCKGSVTDSDRCEQLPQAQRQSNAFDIVFP